MSITQPPAGGKPVNVLIILHGLGDTHESMKILGERMALPETVCISIQGPTPIPFDIGGFHWGDDVVFDQGSDSLDPDTGFKKGTEVVLQITRQLQEKCDYTSRDILLFGYGQGGMLALKIATESTELGGVISIGGPLPSDTVLPVPKSKTPIIALGGSSNSTLTDSSITKLKNTFEFVEYKRWRRPGDGAPRNREEMLPIMQFFARRLRSRHGIPDGSIELS